MLQQRKTIGTLAIISLALLLANVQADPKSKHPSPQPDTDTFIDDGPYGCGPGSNPPRGTPPRNSEFTIVAPYVLPLKRDYVVAVNVHNASQTTQFQLTISNGGDFKLIEKVSVQPWSTKQVTFKIGQLPDPAPGKRYSLIADGLSGVRYHNETSLHVSNKEFALVLTTDKTLYKPGQLVQFRVIVIDWDTKPYDLKNVLQVYITDGDGNRIQQFNNQSTEVGVYTNSLQLSDQPVLGTWTIVAQANQETQQYTFEVAEYVLPTFQTICETPSDVRYSDRTVTINVRGLYTYGKPVHGNATITVRPSYTIDDTEKTVTKQVQITGDKATVTFDLISELHLFEDDSRTLQVDVSLDEQFTKRQQNTTATITVHRWKYIYQRLTYNYNYEDGQPYDFGINVKLYDGTPIANKTLSIGYTPDFTKPRETVAQSYRTDSQGNVKAKITFPSGLHGVFLEVVYDGQVEGIGYILSSVYRPKTYNQYSLQTLTDNPKVGDTIKLELQSEKALFYYTYDLVSRGNIVQSKTVKVTNSTQRTFPISFKATFAMVPSVVVVVYTIRDKNTVDVASSYVYLQSSLSGKLTIQPSVNETQPAGAVDLTIRTDPKSLVCLLGVDQKVLLQSQARDLASAVTGTLNDYGNRYDSSPFVEPADTLRYGWSPVLSTFETSGLVVLSNLYPLLKQITDDTVYRSTPVPFLSKFAGIAQPASIASDSIAGGASGSSVTIRKDFPETWLFESIFSETGLSTLRKKMPDTITSWIVTAFSMNRESGFGATEKPTQITVIKPFFVSVNLPYKTKRGEILAVQVSVNNYLGQRVSADVTLFNDLLEFSFVDIGTDGKPIDKLDKKRIISVAVNDNDAQGTTFLIRPRVIGSMTIKVTAVSTAAGDGLQLLLPVEPEGVPHYINQAWFVNRADVGTSKPDSPFSIAVPANAVQDSARTTASVIGDPLSTTLQHLDSLIYMPTGCGEQNMLNFVPNIVIRKYLQLVNQLTPDVIDKTTRNMIIGYQRELAYRHSNGSFSAFGKNDASGSTWLTAFVVRSFIAASGLIDIDPNVISSAQDFLRYTQSDNGSFVEVGTVIHRQMQGGSGAGIALHAYTLLAFVENSPPGNNTDVIQKASAYLTDNVGSTDLYGLAIAAYTLKLIADPAADDLLRHLDSVAIVAGDLQYWSLPGTDANQNSLNIEITAYVLLAKLQTDDDVGTLVPIVRWLLKQRNAQGGFQSTQDTVVGLQALASFAAKIGFGAPDLQLTIAYTTSTGTAAAPSTFAVTAGNRLVLQQAVVPDNTVSVDATATGQGSALVSLSTKYYVLKSDAPPSFRIGITLLPNDSNGHLLLVQVCVSFVPDADDSSNMAVLLVAFPSGYTFDTDSLGDLTGAPNVKRVDATDGNTLVEVYFNSLNATEQCLVFKAVLTNPVSNRKPAAVQVKDFYDSTRAASAFYSTAENTCCDICQPNCPAVCGAQ